MDNLIKREMQEDKKTADSAGDFLSENGFASNGPETSQEDFLKKGISDIEELFGDDAENLFDVTEDDFDAPDPEPDRSGADRPTGERDRAAEDRNDRRAIESAARLFTQTMDMAVSRMCGMISGDDYSMYKLTAQEKSDYTSATTEYMIATGFRPNIHIQFWMLTASMFGASAYKANQSRLAKIRIAETQKQQEVRRVKMDVIREQVRETVENVKSQKLPVRKQYKMNKEGFYLYPETGGGYIKNQEEREKAPDHIIAMSEQLLKDGKSQAEVNELIFEAEKKRINE